MRIKQVFILVFLVSLIGLASAWADNGSVVQNVDGCNLLNTTGAIYTLTGNVTSTGHCFSIGSQNITLDCAGNWITYSMGGAANTYGINTTQFNTTIKNCNVLDGNWGSAQTSRYGIYFNTNDYSTLFNNFVNTSKSTAIYLYNNANYNNLTLNTIIANSTGALVLSPSSNNFISNTSTFSNTGSGIYLDSSLNNTLTNVNATSYTNYGLYLQFISNSTLTNVNANSTIIKKDLYFMPNSVYDCNNTFTNVTSGEYKSIIYIKGNYSNLSDVDGSLLILCNANFSNITNSNFTRGGIRLFHSHQNTLSNINVSSNTEKTIYIYSSSKNNNLNNIFSSSDTNYGITIDGSNNTLTNINSTSNTNYGITISGSGNNLTNVDSSSNTQFGLYLLSASNNRINNANLTSNTSYGLRIFSGSNNILSNINIKSNTSYGLHLASTSNNNMSNITASSGNNTVVRLDSNSDSNSIINSTLISLNNNGTLLYLASDCNYNVFYWNNFTNTSGYYVQDLNGSNYYNKTINGTSEGNIWYDVMNGSVNISGSINSTGYPLLYIGKYGTSYPYKNTTSFGKISGNVVDYAPLTEQFGEDTTPPTYNNVNHNSTETNQITKFSIFINDNDFLHPNGQYIFSIYNNRDWINDSAINFTETSYLANITKILNSSEEASIMYRWYFTDNLGNTNSTPIYSFTAMSPFSCLGEGTSENPYNITTCIQLQQMNHYLSAHYQLVNNINCSNTLNWNGGLGFEPVGKNNTNRFYFNGTFNGNDYNVTDLFINRSSRDYVGLFGYSKGDISNVRLVNVNITGKNYVGGLVGFSSYEWPDYRVIENSYVGGDINGNYTVGGIGGYLYGTYILYSHSEGSVNGSSYIGGIAGEGTSGYINNSYSTANVNGIENYVGGLVGSQNYGTIFESYSTGNVSGIDYVGGIIGGSWESNQKQLLKKSYSTGNINGRNYTGGAVGYSSTIMMSIYIEDSYSTGNVNGTGNYVGAFAGYFESGGISNSYSTGDVSSSGNYTGGFVGYLLGSISDSYSTGDVSSSGNYTGGFVGRSAFGTISNSYAIGSVIGISNVSGFVGYKSNTNLINNYWYNQSQELNCYSGGNINCTAISYLSYFYNYENSPMNLTSGDGWNFYSVWDDMLNGTDYPILKVTKFSGEGYGTYENPFEITNCTQLQEMKNYLNSYFQLVNNINCSDTINWNSGLGFEPVGKNSTSGFYFSGNFNGNDYNITNLFINRSSSDYVGLFAVSSGYTNNVRLVNVVINGKDYVGGIVGYFMLYFDFGLGGEIYNELEYSYVSGNITGNNYVGGIAGYYKGIINSSYAVGNISGNNYVGGLVGYLGQFASIYNSYSLVEVNAINYTGGIGGYSEEGSIDNSYSRGNVTGVNYVGGLVGYLGGWIFIDNSYSTGNVSGNNNIGGLIGYKESGSITNSYWYNRSQGLNCYSDGNTDCTAISDLDYFYNYENKPMNLTSGNGWDFVSVWDDVYNGTDYPVLKWQGVEEEPDIYPNISFVNPTTSSGEHIQTFITANVSVGNASSIVNLTIFLYNSSSGNLILENSTTSNKLFWNITGLSLGNYSLNASVEDSEGLTNSTSTLSVNLTVFSDTLSPTYSSVSHNSTYVNQASIFSVNVNDETALHTNGQYIFSTNNTGVWVNESAANFTSTPQSISITKTLNSVVGTVVGYMWFFSDDNENVNSTSIYTLTTIAVPVVNPPSGGGGGGGSTTQNQTQHNYQLGREFSEQGETFQLRKNNYIGFKHGEESHTMTLDRFDSRSARITIRSDPITVDLNKGELEEFDLDNDGEEDIEVLYNGIVDSEAQIFVKKFVVITGESEVFANSEGGEAREREESGNTVVNTGNLGAGISVEKPKKERNPLRTALISFIVMGMIIMILAMIGRNEKRKKDRYSSFFDN